MFKIGDKVKLVKGSRYYIENTPYNPAEVEGVINRVITENSIKVDWDNGEKNSYAKTDLELVINKESILESYNKFKKIPEINSVISKEERVDLAEITKYNSFKEAGLNYEEVATLLSLYETALRRAEEKLEFYNILFEEGLEGLEKEELTLETGKNIVEKEKENKKKQRISSGSGNKEVFTITLDRPLKSSDTISVDDFPPEDNYYEEDEYEEEVYEDEL